MKAVFFRRALIFAGLVAAALGSVGAFAEPAKSPAVPAASAAPSAAPSPSASAASTSVAAPSPTVDGVSLLTRWLKVSPEVAGWRTQVGAARFDVVTANVWPNPELNVSGSGLVTGAPPDGDYGITVQVTAPLPILGQRGARKDAAEKLVGVAEANVAGLLWDRASDIHEAMVEQAFAAARVATLERNIEELSRLQRIVGLRSKEGASGRYDVLRASTQEATLQASMRNAAIDRDQAESRLLGLIADTTLKAAPITPEGLPHLANLDETTLVNRALAHRPDFLTAKRAETASEAEAQHQRKEAIPTPSVYVQSYTIGKTFGWQVTGGVSFPVPLSDRRQGPVGRALEEARGHAFEARAVEARIRAEVAGAYRTRERARQALDQLRGHVLPDALELVHRAEVTYQAGDFSIAELFDAYGALWEVRTQELELLKQLAEAEVGLARAAVLLPVDLQSK